MITLLDRSSKCHLLVIQDQKGDIDSLAQKEGYVHLHLNTTLESSLKTLCQMIDETPTTDADLPHTSPFFYSRYPNEWFDRNDVTTPLQRLSFGPMLIPIPQNYTDYLIRAYGEEWNDVAYVDYDHKQQQRPKKIKVDLIDRSPPPFIFPDTD